MDRIARCYIGRVTNLGGRPNKAGDGESSQGTSTRGRRRREQLLDAGVALLTEGGWPAVTTRAVAERAGANLGLVHYHFGGRSQLHQAIARRAGEQVFGPLTTALLAAEGVDDLLERLAATVVASPLAAPGPEPDRVAAARLTVELMAGAVRDPAVGEVLRRDMAAARARLTEWLATHAPDAPQGAAALLMALVDGLLTHHLLDPAAGTGQAVDALTRYVRGDASQQPGDPR